MAEWLSLRSVEISHEWRTLNSQRCFCIFWFESNEVLALQMNRQADDVRNTFIRRVAKHSPHALSSAKVSTFFHSEISSWSPDITCKSNEAKSGPLNSYLYKYSNRLTLPANLTFAWPSHRSKIAGAYSTMRRLQHTLRRPWTARP